MDKQNNAMSAEVESGVTAEEHSEQAAGETFDGFNNSEDTASANANVADSENNIGLSSAAVMTSGTLKLMDGQYGGGFYVKFVQDEGTAYGWLYLVICYPDGSVKGIVLYKNALIETTTEDDGVMTFKKPVHHTNFDRPEMDYYAPLKRYETPTMPIPAKELWARILDNYSKIPIQKINQTGTIEDIYEALRECSERLSREYEKGFMYGPSEFWVPKENFFEVIASFGREVSAVRTELNLRGLFVKDRGKGYQKSKREDGSHAHYYVLRNGFSSEIEPPIELEDTSFSQTGMTKSGQTIARLKDELKKMTLDYNGKALEFGFDPVI